MGISIRKVFIISYHNEASVKLHEYVDGLLFSINHNDTSPLSLSRGCHIHSLSEVAHPLSLGVAHPLSLGGVTSTLSQGLHILSLPEVAHPLSLGGCTSSLTQGWHIVSLSRRLHILSLLGVAHRLSLGGGTSSLSRGCHILSLSGVAHPLSLGGCTSSFSRGWHILSLLGLHILSLSRVVAHHPHCGCCRPQLQNRQQ